MAKKSIPGVVVNKTIAFPESWVEELTLKARKLSLKHSKDITFAELVRHALEETYKLKMPK
jgi:hypothetical protein